MTRVLLTGLSMLLVSATAFSDDADDATSDQEAAEQPQTTLGMSILGNEEAPKSLVIVPWKSSELGEDLSISNTLDERARPVDKAVFLRELRYYAIRSGD